MFKLVIGLPVKHHLSNFFLIDNVDELNSGRNTFWNGGI